LPETRPSPSHNASAETASLLRSDSAPPVSGGGVSPSFGKVFLRAVVCQRLRCWTPPKIRPFASPLTGSCTVSASTSREGRQRSGSRLSWGLRPSSRHRLRESARLPVTDRSVPDPRKHHPGACDLSALRLSQPLGGLTPPAAWRPCFMPHATCRVPSLQGVSLPGSLDQTRRLAVPSCRYRLTCQKPRRPKPAALPSMRPTDFRALLRLKVRSLRSDVTRSTGPIPSWDSVSSPGLSRSLPCFRFTSEEAWLRLRSCPWSVGLARLWPAFGPEGLWADRSFAVLRT
jgi:hypothetical protein